MNERIKQLALEAFEPINDMASEGIADRHTFNMHWFQLYNQKFAELIVRECGDVAYNAYWENPETVRGIHIKEKIKQHFGVEE
jgi:hypothetical protein